MKAKDIKPNPNNPRIIKDDKFQKLVQSLKSFPEMAVVRPVIINEDNMILGGNMRYKAMIEAGWDDIPITQVKGWTKEQEQEFIIKDNVSGGEWDWDVLANEWDTDLLDEWGLDVPAGFGDEEVEEDEAPAVSDEPAVSRLGEIYQLGRHRVMCGDSTKSEDVESLMGGALADMVFTDPPYGVDYDGGHDKSKHEPCLYMFKKGKSPQWYGANNEISVWDISRASKNEYHPTQKPIELVARAVKNSSKSGDIVLDLFLGSGSTLIACEQTDRTCYGMELDPKYVDVIRKRYAKYTNNNDLPENWEELTPCLSQ